MRNYGNEKRCDEWQRQKEKDFAKKERCVKASKIKRERDKKG